MKKTTRVRRQDVRPGAGRGAVAEYIAHAPASARGMLRAMRSVIRAALPRDAVETISYQIPAFKRKKVLVWYGAFTDHCSLFPTAAAIHACKKDLEGFTISKGTVQFPIGKPLPVRLIRHLVRTRVVQADGGRAEKR